MIRLREVYESLLTRFGPQNWWPGESPFEVMVGAMLVQNTAWKNVQHAIDNLREEGLLSLDALRSMPLEELAELIRSAGYFRLKAARLHNLLEFLHDRYDGSIQTMREHDTDTLRRELLSVNGIGPETADSILLYALDRPTFVVDTYTHRVLARHGWIGYDADYHTIQELFENSLEEDVSLYNEFHALLVRVGHLYCRKTPQCEDCPLRDRLPEGGLVTPD